MPEIVVSVGVVIKLEVAMPGCTGPGVVGTLVKLNTSGLDCTGAGEAETPLPDRGTAGIVAAISGG